MKKVINTLIISSLILLILSIPALLIYSVITGSTIIPKRWEMVLTSLLLILCFSMMCNIIIHRQKVLTAIKEFINGNP